MITNKRQMLKLISTCAQAGTLNREEKFIVFCRVCDNMLAEGKMTKATHKRFTEIFWWVTSYDTALSVSFLVSLLEITLIS